MKEKKQWCGEHRPESDVCPKHYRGWHELCRSDIAADEELLLRGVLSIFYCPIWSCDEFKFYYDSSKAKIRMRDYYMECVLNNTIRLKILFHKLGEREKNEKTA